jgi:antitoxin component YwqK of YwqJK toxin-antitoxin module
MNDDKNNIVVAKTIDDFDVILETFDKKPHNFSCIICMYDTDENEAEMEKILTKKSQSPISRYCRIKTSHSYLCDHPFHTACLHEWFIQSKQIKCPLCQLELELHNDMLNPIKKIYVDEPKFVRTMYDFSHGFTKPHEEYYVLDDKKHGPYKNYSIVGHLYRECTYLNGVKEGIEFEYFPNSKVKSMYTYLKGKKNGKFWVKSPGGWYIIKGEYKNDKFNGIVRRWDEQSRALIFVCQYLNGKKQGPEITWHTLPFLDVSIDAGKKYQSPQIKSYSMYDHNVLHGFVLLYSCSGILIKKAHYCKGVLHGTYIENYDCGSKKCNRIYSMGNVIGVSKKWYMPEKLSQLSQLSHLERYVLDDGVWKKDGVWMEWYRNGMVKRYMPYMFAKLHGRALYLNENGNPIEIGDYKNGKLHGEYYLYYNKLSLLKDSESQKLHWVMKFNEGNMHGKCIEYNTRGLSKLELDYDNGTLIFSEPKNVN